MCELLYLNIPGGFTYTQRILPMPSVVVSVSVIIGRFFDFDRKKTPLATISAKWTKPKPIPNKRKKGWTLSDIKRCHYPGYGMTRAEASILKHRYDNLRLWWSSAYCLIRVIRTHHSPIHQSNVRRCSICVFCRIDEHSSDDIRRNSNRQNIGVTVTYLLFSFDYYIPWFRSVRLRFFLFKRCTQEHTGQPNRNHHLLRRAHNASVIQYRRSDISIPFDMLQMCVRFQFLEWLKWNELYFMTHLFIPRQ